MTKKIWGIVILALVAAGVAGYFVLNREAEPPPPAQVAAAPVAVPVTPPPPPAPPTPVPPEPVIIHPLELGEGAVVLPDLDQSDAPVLKALNEVLGQKWKALLMPESLIRSIVATVDQLPRQYLPANVVPLKRAPGKFITHGEGETLSIDARNSRRYAAHIRLIQSINSGALVSVYRQFYPLFQGAYAEISGSNAYFNDRLIEAIDDLLAAPEPEGTIRLAQPRILYAYADADLEARSAGQKIMIRMGRDNALKVKAKLREIRLLVARNP